jgi:hypothetical protein
MTETAPSPSKSNQVGPVNDDDAEELAVDPFIKQIATHTSTDGCLKAISNWSDLRERLKHRFKAIQYHVRDQEIIGKAEPLVSEIEYRLEQMDEAPWTIQRLCELLAVPEMNYQDYFKFLRAIQKVRAIDICNSHIIIKKQTVIVSSGFKRFVTDERINLRDRRISPFQKPSGSDDDDVDHVVPLRTRIAPLQERPTLVSYSDENGQPTEVVVLNSPPAESLPEQQPQSAQDLMDTS